MDVDGSPGSVGSWLWSVWSDDRVDVDASCGLVLDLISGGCDGQTPHPLVIV